MTMSAFVDTPVNLNPPRHKIQYSGGSNLANMKKKVYLFFNVNFSNRDCLFPNIFQASLEDIKKSFDHNHKNHKEYIFSRKQYFLRIFNAQ